MPSSGIVPPPSPGVLTTTPPPPPPPPPPLPPRESEFAGLSAPCRNDHQLSATRRGDGDGPPAPAPAPPYPMIPWIDPATDATRDGTINRPGPTSIPWLYTSPSIPKRGREGAITCRLAPSMRAELEETKASLPSSRCSFSIRPSMVVLPRILSVRSRTHPRRPSRASLTLPVPSFAIPSEGTRCRTEVEDKKGVEAEEEAPNTRGGMSPRLSK